MDNEIIAIVIIAYNRAHSLQRLLKYVSQATYYRGDIPLIISIDYHKENGDVIKVAESFEWKYGKKIIRTHSHNIGLREHVFECGRLTRDYGTVIILEDDAIVAPDFYNYVMECQKFYEFDERIAGVSLYAHRMNGYAMRWFLPVLTGYDVYFGQFGMTRGQSWTYKQWSSFEQWLSNNEEFYKSEDDLMPLKIFRYKNAWSKYYIRYIIETDKYYVIPYEPLASVFCDDGVHTNHDKFRSTIIQVSLNWGQKYYSFPKFDAGAHYNIYFENVDVRRMLCNKLGTSELCMDLNDISPKDRIMKNDRYLVTTKKMNKKIIESYSLELRPIEMNIVKEIPGTGIYIYDMSINEKNKLYDWKQRIEYDLGGIKSKEALMYAIMTFVKDNIKFL